MSSEHKLAAEFGMARMTVNRAMRELATQRVLCEFAGQGPLSPIPVTGLR
ncbi:GntR family transcriptional regulator [Paraburkholderia xenovorans]